MVHRQKGNIHSAISQIKTTGIILSLITNSNDNLINRIY